MLRRTSATAALLTLALTTLAACGSDDPKTAGSAAPTTRAADEGEDADEEPAQPAAADTSAAGVDTSAPVTAVDSTTVPSGSDVPSTDAPATDAPSTDAPPETLSPETDGPDVIDDTVIDDTVTDASDVIDISLPDDTMLLPPPSEEVCALLLSTVEYQGMLETFDEDTSDWNDVKVFDATETPAVIETYEAIAELVPELAEHAANAIELVEWLSEIIQAVDSFEEGNEIFEQISQEETERVLDLSESADVIDDYAEECPGYEELQDAFDELSS